ncbi:phosphotransferase [Cohnella sp. 56]|uniref:phosphotransferase n=1 Tax=Cohnella sp. 56 TaxID=3113722 RepID=UPI0030EA9E13
MSFEALLSRYEPDARWRVSQGESGWNNTTRIAESEDGVKRVLRVYETHKDADKIAFEHDVLRKLADAGLPFAVPRPIAALDGATYVMLDDGSGRYAAMFSYTEGIRPDGRDPVAAAAIGAAVGRLSAALRDIRPDAAPAYLPCYELEHTHPSCPQQVIASFCAEPPAPFADLRDPLARIGAALGAFGESLPALRALPHQLVHGDVNDSNLLADIADSGRIVAVLDFEFCTHELRAMEPAVVLAGLIEDETAFDAAAAFLSGFCGIVPLSEAEIESLPMLMRLRRLDVFVHFLGRYLSGVDQADVLRQQLQEADAGLAVLDRNSVRLQALCRASLGTFAND